MKQQLARSFKRLAIKDKKIIFITGDLGFNAFEELQQTMKGRFINAGIAEHNMVTLAAGLAYMGFKTWIYSIAPFITIKVLEEIRNDISLTKSDIKIIGLGAGFDYGLAGPTHHAIQDVGAILSLPNMKVYAPGFIEDVDTVIDKIYRYNGPVYLRLSKEEKARIKIPRYAPLRRINRGIKVTVVVLGNIIHEVIKASLLLKDNLNSVDIWIVSELPLKIEPDLIDSIKRTKKIIVVEEHVAVGGLGAYLSSYLMENYPMMVEQYIHKCVSGYKSRNYGDRQFHLKENDLDAESIFSTFKKFTS